MTNPTTVLVFGVFDHLHDGHRFFLDQAQKQADKLIISVARDSAVALHKQKSPDQNESERVAYLKQQYPEAIVALGDEQQDTWGAIHTYHPTYIALGYDQHALRARLKEIKETFEYPFELITITDHRGDELHSSILKQKRS